MDRIPRWLIGLVSFSILALILWYFSAIVIYILIAGVLSLTGQPTMRFLDRIRIGKYKIPKWGAAIITMFSTIIVIVGILAIFIPVLVLQFQDFAEIDYNAMSVSLQEQIHGFEAWANQYGLLPEGQTNLLEYAKAQLKQVVSFSNVSDAANTAISTTGNLFMGSFSVLFVLFFFLKDKDMFFRIIIALSPVEYEDRVSSSLKQSKQLLSRYFIGIMAQISIVVILLSLGLYFIAGLKNALLIAAIAGLFNIIPYIGPLIGAAIGILLGIAVNLDMDFHSEMLPLILTIAAIFFTVQMIDNLLLQPLIFGNSVKAHPLEIFVVILAASQIAGITGMILAIPVYTILRVVAKEFFSDQKIVKKLTKDI